MYVADQRWPVSNIPPDRKIALIILYFLYLELHESSRLELKNILPLLREIKPDKILSLGLQLDVEKTELRMITTQNKDNLEREIFEIIDYWLGNSKDQSWEALAKAVRRLGGHDQLASKLENNQCSSEVVGNQSGMILGMHELISPTMIVIINMCAQFYR